MYNHCAGCFSHRLRHSPSQSPFFCKTVHNIFFSVNCRLRKLLPRNISVDDSILLYRIGFLIMYTMKFYADFESLKRKTQLCSAIRKIDECRRINEKEDKKIAEGRTTTPVSFRISEFPRVH